jgi:uncharacterized protein (DUF608 family)
MPDSFNQANTFNMKTQHSSPTNEAANDAAETRSFLYKGEHTREISFPLGGIGSGCIGLGGSGQLIDWEIFNRPNKGRPNGMSHFAVRAEKNGKVVDARILQGDLEAPYTGSLLGAANDDPLVGSYAGFGVGPWRETLCGMPHFKDHSFRGEYPFAWIDFADDSFPGRAELCAWSPFIPGNTEDSSLPAACFEVTLANDTSDTLDYTVLGALFNPFLTDTAQNRYSEENGIKQLIVSGGGDKEDLAYGDLTLSTDAEQTSYQEYWYHGRMCDDLEVYWNDLGTPGPLKNRTYPAGGKKNTGTLAAHVALQPGERKTVRFVITWNVPNRENDWQAGIEELCSKNRVKNRWKNWYATRWADSPESGAYAFDAYERVRADTAAFHRALFNSTLPPHVLEGVSANLSILKSPTCLRLEDGTFYGWEGSFIDHGSCQGSCTHVWNYNQALPFLFPALERSLRESHYNYSVDEHGGCYFRLMLPLGIRTKTVMRPCVDGQFGDVMKAYRDWKISGDTSWLASLWPVIKKSIEYAWSEKNPDRWDPDRTGVITGRQHHTLDKELFGPSAWLNGHYLGALKAAAEMAEVMDEPEFAGTCRDLFQKGKMWTDEHLFNGEYYGQQIKLNDRALLESFSTGVEEDPNNLWPDDAVKTYWSGEHGQIKYQIGEGCQIDMHLPQWYATLYGLGEVLDPDQTRQTLRALYKHNYKTSLRHFANPWRNYSVNDEAGMVICTWPEGTEKPIIPLPYNGETMDGFQWAAAAHMIMHGMVEEGLTVVKSLRSRYDGKKRNPWNEFECGSNYARSLASYGLLHAFSGFTFDTTRKMIGFHPITPGEFRCFWSLGHAWGEFSRNDTTAELSVLYGQLEIEELRMAAALIELKSGQETLAFSLQAEGTIRLKSPLVVTKAHPLRITCKQTKQEEETLL